MFQTGGLKLEHSEQGQGSEAFGAYLKKLREGRRLSLDAVEELSGGFPEKVTKSHLSRIENGLALPSFPRLMAMSHIYGVPIASMAERYEIELRRDMKPVESMSSDPSEVLARIRALELEGRYDESILLASAWLEQRQSGDEDIDPKVDRALVHFNIHLANGLMHLGRYEYAKTIAEQLLSRLDLANPDRFLSQEIFVICCYRLRRFTIALMALQHAETESFAEDVRPLDRARLEVIRGNVEYSLGKLDDAVGTYERALHAIQQAGDAFEECRTRINLASALIDLRRFDEAEQQLVSAAQSADEGGYERFKALIASNEAAVAFRRGDEKKTEECALRSNSIARPQEYHSVVVRNCYYLWRVARSREDTAGMRAAERSIRTYSSRVEEHIEELDEFRLLSVKEDQ
jgi:tetratricopeptide (TPR) repeat protein